MKDYYNILGVKKNATFYDITEAYRELSITYHPDNHEGDEAYVQKYNDVQEAYAILSNGIKRKEYDNNYIYFEKKSKEKVNNAVPSIDYFRSDKLEFEFGDEITFSWKTSNADKVTLVPFGEVQPSGSQSEKIKNYKNKLLTYELLAENTVNGKETKASVSLKNKNYEEFLNHFKKEADSQFKPVAPSQVKAVEIEKEHAPYLPRKKETDKEAERNIIKENVFVKTTPTIEKPIEHRPQPENNNVKKSESSENNILLFIVILFLVVGISILIYLGFFMQ
ncbi:MAG: DnaJ domain-containing protein [Bacteroidota bacterium]|nr:DnaJ domain-containing protein [Bacteroidota bacterium]